MAEFSRNLFKDIKTRPHQRMPVSFSIKNSCNISRTKIDMFQDDSDGQGSSEGGKGSRNGVVGSGSHKSSSESPNNAESSRPKMSYNLSRPQTATSVLPNDLLKLPSPKLPRKPISNLMEPKVSREKCFFEKSSLILDHDIEDLETKLEAYNKEFQKNKMLPDSVSKSCQQSGMNNGQGSVVNLGHLLTKGDEHHFTAFRLNRNIIVSEIKSPSNFYIQFCKSAIALNDLEKAMESEYEGALLERLKLRREDMKEGLYVVCRHSGQWRRAQILKKVGDAHAKVLHIDFGCEQIKCHDEIFFLLDKPIFKIAAMAFPATLHNIKPVGILDWMNASTRRFTSLVNLGDSDMLVAKYYGGGSMTDPTYQLSLSVFLKKGEVIQVGDKLIEEMLAEAATPKIAF
ncbi:uncharacterized protein LOC135940447 isoform X2 [Cloeon dipterum]|uniref:uncharacterized protein LOC135940447 isoform X2 n=1 Tax=Cloeon dipterum TaxID=197152 RepID=UPI00321F93DD